MANGQPKKKDKRNDKRVSELRQLGGHKAARVLAEVEADADGYRADDVAESGSSLGPESRYYFSVSSPLNALRVKRSEARGPRGTRVHVSYGTGSQVRTDKDSYQASWVEPLPAECAAPKPLNDAEKSEWEKRGWNGIDGRVLSGADFLLVRLDGVLELDGRVTIQAKDETLIDATYWGLVDLERDWAALKGSAKDLAALQQTPEDLARARARGEAVASKAYLQFVEGGLSGTLAVQLCVRFETNTGPWASSAEAQDSTWTAASRIKHEENVWKYRDLVRNQFLGRGTMEFDVKEGTVTSPTRIDLQVFSLDARRGQRV